MKYDLSEITDVIKDRRTIHPENFSEREVQQDMVKQILTNALWAPTHKRTQPWRFKVYSGAGKSKLIELTESLYKDFAGAGKVNPVKVNKLKDRITRTSVIVALVMERTVDENIPEIEEIEAVACAAQNMMLTATAYGLGSFWSSPKFLYAETAPEKFGFKKADKIMGLLYFGYPKGDWPKSHRKPLEYVTEWVNE